ncbi:MAG TPA: thioredoxin [Micromonosporaceae bacterium]|nr:thioredoxin [Micromonosporaceae bacterium]
MLQESETGSLVNVTDDTFAEMVLASDRPVAVDFWAEWCPPCRVISRSLTELAEEFGEQMAILKINSDENPMATRTYRIMSLPTVLVFRNGEVVATIVGSKPKTHLRQALSAAMAGA